MKKKTIVTVISVIMALSFAACGGSSDYSVKNSAATDGYYSSGDYVTAEYESGFYGEEAAESYADENVKVTDQTRKLIEEYDVYVETEDFDGLLDLINDRVNAFNGYIESSNTNNGSRYYGGNRRNASLTVRIPQNKAKEFLNVIGENSNITTQSLNVTDVTLQYVDLESQKNAYTVEEERLMDLLEQAESLEDILLIEDRLSSVRYKLESMESQLRVYDNRVNYSTFRLDIEEVKEYTEPEPESYGERITRSFKEGLSRTVDGLREFSIGFVGELPALVVACVLIFIFVKIILFFARKDKRKAKKEKKNKKAKDKDGAE